MDWDGGKDENKEDEFQGPDWDIGSEEKRLILWEERGENKDVWNTVEKPKKIYTYHPKFPV